MARNSLRATFVAVFLVPLLMLTSLPAHAQTQDSVVGSGTAGTGTFDINAVSGPSGENPTGHANFELAIGSVQGTVTCLFVSGNEATIGATLPPGNPFNSPGMIVHVRDNGVLPTGVDQFRLELLAFVPPACPAVDLISPSNVTSGDIKVTDAVSSPPWSGLLQPIDTNATNVATAGSAIPAKFSLFGFEGLNIFAAGFPKSQQVPCNTSLPEDSIEQTASSTAKTLTYDAKTDTYTYVWKTSKSWAGTCRTFTVKLNDGNEQTVLFRFK
jgi:hypothetical protein